MISINTNIASSMGAYNLANTNTSLQKSLQRLSSGSRINSSLDDAGGLAVSMKLSASIRRTEATQSNVNNALSFLQTQDGVLKNMDKILNRLSELSTMALDVTKSEDDKGLYDTEADSLVAALGDLEGELFNGISLFDGSTLSVVTSEDGGQTFDINAHDVSSISGLTLDLGGDAATALSDVKTAIEALAAIRATNGAEQSRISFASDILSINKVNLEAANSRIADVDIASESANLAKFNILQQAGTAMLAQANMSQQSVLRLLM